jgi:hypothetical protein
MGISGVRCLLVLIGKVIEIYLTSQMKDARRATSIFSTEHVFVSHFDLILSSKHPVRVVFPVLSMCIDSMSASAYYLGAEY